MNVGIVDYGMGNLASVERAFEVCGAQNTFITEDPKKIDEATHVVLPGVGAFRDGMKHLTLLGWIDPLLETLKQGIPFLGICLGMQLLAETGEEGGETKGLGVISGKVTRMQQAAASERIPHVGWNEVTFGEQEPLLNGVTPGTDFYFVHSYHFVPKDDANIMTRTPYCGEIVTGVKQANVYGVQFHPEKSSSSGFQILKNFLEL